MVKIFPHITPVSQNIYLKTCWNNSKTVGLWNIKLEAGNLNLASLKYNTKFECEHCLNTIMLRLNKNLTDVHAYTGC